LSVSAIAQLSVLIRKFDSVFYVKKLIHRRAAENAERKSFSRSGDADLEKKLRLAGSFSKPNPVLCPKGCSIWLSAISAENQMYLNSVNSASRMSEANGR